MKNSRIKRIFLFFLCLVHYVFHGPAKRIPKKISRIIVVPDGKMGDVICGTPVLAAIREHLPESHLVVAGNTSFQKNLLSDSGLVDEYLDIESSGAISRIRNCKADIAVVTGISFDVAAALYIAGIPCIVIPVVQEGFSLMTTRLYRIIQRFFITILYRAGEYMPRARLRVLEPIGIFTDDTKKRLGFSKFAKERILKFFTQNGITHKKDFIIGISSTAGNKIKEWPKERFVEIADYLVEAYKARIMLMGTAVDMPKLNWIKSNMQYANRATIVHVSLDELKALISMLSLFISVDTGPIYVAEAFNIPTINIIGPMDERVQPPQGFLHRNVLPKRTHPQLSVLNARLYDREEALRQVLSISVQDVKNAINTLVEDMQ